MISATKLNELVFGQTSQSHIALLDVCICISITWHILCRNLFWHIITKAVILLSFSRYMPRHAIETKFRQTLVSTVAADFQPLAVFVKSLFHISLQQATPCDY